MEYKVEFFKKPPQGITLVENEEGYTIHINSIDWNIFPLWVIMAGGTLASIIACIVYDVYGALIGSVLLFYFSYLITTIVFIKAKLRIIKNILQLYTFMDIINNSASYSINLQEINSLRCTTSGRSSASGNNWGAWKKTAHHQIELTGIQKKSNDAISVYTKEYNIFISQFLNEYIKSLK